MALALKFAAFCLLLVLQAHVDGKSYFFKDALPDDAKDAEWSYHGSNGPEFWCNLNPPYPECCKEKQSQSPVNINADATKFPADLLQPENYDVIPRAMTLINNKHYALLEYESDQTPSISIDFHGVRKVFGLDHVHFHVGKVSNRGSEHTLNKMRYPMEMHFLHRLQTYKSLWDASKNPESIAVIGVFFELSRRNNSQLNALIDNLKLVKYGSDEATIRPFKFSQLFPSRSDHFFTYDGSLTSPPCTENVRWIVLDAKIPISEAQLNEFRQLQEKPLSENPNNAFPIVDNGRELQNLHNRPVYKSRNRR